MSDQDPIEQLRKLITQALSHVLRIDHREKHPLSSVYGENPDPSEIHPDERERLLSYDVVERQQLAEVAARIASAADWPAVAADLEQQVEAHRSEARRLYDERMAKAPEEPSDPRCVCPVPHTNTEDAGITSRACPIHGGLLP